MPSGQIARFCPPCPSPSTHEYNLHWPRQPDSPQRSISLLRAYATASRRLGTKVGATVAYETAARLQSAMILVGKNLAASTNLAVGCFSTPVSLPNDEEITLPNK